MTPFEITMEKELNKEQFETAMLMDGPAVIMAGAGSGKTHTLISRVAHLVDSGVHPSQILMLTFTNKAANEMADRASKKVAGSGAITACTYHSFAYKLLRIYKKELGFHDCQPVSTTGHATLIDLVRNRNSCFEPMKKMKTKVIDEIISKSINKMESVEAVMQSEDQYAEYLPFAHMIDLLKVSVDNKKRHDGVLTYDDMLFYADKLLDNDVLCRKIAMSFRYIMIDEFQDTNNLQESFVLKIAKYNRNIVVVGDISQSIYKFRAANVKNIQMFHLRVGTDEMPCKEIVLHQNYRSSQEILHAVNAVMRRNVNGWTYYDMVSGTNKHGTKPKLIYTNNQKTEAEYVLDMVKSYHNGGVPYAEMAILARSSKSFEQFEKLLVQHRIPYVKHGGPKFFELDCIEMIFDYFRFYMNNRNESAIYHILQIHPNLGKAYSSDIAGNISEGLCTLKTAKMHTHAKDRTGILKPVTFRIKEQINRLDNLYERLSEEPDFHKQFRMIAEFYENVMENAIQTSGKSVENKNEAIDDLRIAMKYIKELEVMSLEYDDPVKFVDELALDMKAKEEELGDSLVLSTVHSAKGLEWRVVFVLDCVDGAFPVVSDMLTWGDENDSEELRCFYVAMTRAKDELCLMIPSCILGADRMPKQVNMCHYLLQLDRSVIDNVFENVYAYERSRLVW